MLWGCLVEIVTLQTDLVVIFWSHSGFFGILIWSLCQICGSAFRPWMVEWWWWGRVQLVGWLKRIRRQSRCSCPCRQLRARIASLRAQMVRQRREIDSLTKETFRFCVHPESWWILSVWVNSTSTVFTKQSFLRKTTLEIEKSCPNWKDLWEYTPILWTREWSQNVFFPKNCLIYQLRPEELITEELRCAEAEASNSAEKWGKHRWGWGGEGLWIWWVCVIGDGVEEVCFQIFGMVQYVKLGWYTYYWLIDWFKHVVNVLDFGQEML